jgi:hypothetical protein
MRDDFDTVVADRFKVLDQVPVPDTWSRIRTAEELLTVFDLDTTVPDYPRPKRPTRLWVAGILAAAAAIIAIALVVPGDGDEPSPVVTVAPTPPPAPLFGAAVEEFVPGTYFVDEVDGTPTPRIFVTLGGGFDTEGEWAFGNDAGFITFSQPDRVDLDACHSAEGLHPGPLTTLDGLVAALTEQQGWVDVTVPTDITVDGYEGKAFQRTAPAEFVDCNFEPPFRGWQYDDGGGWSYYFEGEVETLWVLDVDGEIIIVNTRTGADQSPAAHAELVATRDSIRINPPPAPLFGAAVEEFVPGTYFVDEVDGIPTPRIFITLGDGWSTEGGRRISHEAGYITFSQPDLVYLDACHSADGLHPPLTTVSGLVKALREQRGWVDVTDRTVISVNGYLGQAFQRTAPNEFVDCDSSFAPFRSWQDDEGGLSYYSEGEIETLWVLNVDSEITVMSTRAGADQPAAAQAGLVATRDSIRIDPG